MSTAHLPASFEGEETAFLEAAAKEKHMLEYCINACGPTFISCDNICQCNLEIKSDKFT